MRSNKSAPSLDLDFVELPDYPGMAPKADAPIGELLAYIATSQRRLEIWARLLHEQQEQMAGQVTNGQKKRMAVSVRDVEIPFGSMVGLLVTVAFASIPALIIIGIMMFVTFLVLSAVFTGVL